MKYFRKYFLVKQLIKQLFKQINRGQEGVIWAIFSSFQKVLLSDFFGVHGCGKGVGMLLQLYVGYGIHFVVSGAPRRV